MNILIVDNDIDYAIHLSELLILNHHRVKIETQSDLALKLYKQEKIDVVITELRLADINGIALLKKLKEINKHARVIIMTSFGDFKTAKEAINNQSYGYLEKPFRIDELLSILDEIEDESAEPDSMEGA